jgi:hypothetical protein
LSEEEDPDPVVTVSRVASPMEIDPSPLSALSSSDPLGLFAGEAVDSGSIVELGTGVDANTSQQGEPSGKESDDVINISTKSKRKGEPKRRSPNKRVSRGTPAYIYFHSQVHSSFTNVIGR